MDLTAQLDLGDLRLRTLFQDDAELLVEATRHERAPALWAPRPAGPYSLDDARTALRQWDPARRERASYGVLRADRLGAPGRPGAAVVGDRAGQHRLPGVGPPRRLPAGAAPAAALPLLA